MTADPSIQGPKFYGRRRVRRLRKELQAWMDAGAPQFGIDKNKIITVTDGSLHPQDFFPSHYPLFTNHYLEIGFGGGEHVIGLAQLHPDVAIIGCEAFENGVAHLFQDMMEKNLSNIRCFGDDVRLLLPKLPDECLDRVYLLYPDPWPKKRHARRRFVNADNIRQLARILKPKGQWIMATDHDGYRNWVIEQMAAQQHFIPTIPSIWHEQEPVGWTTTRYEQKAKKAGRHCTYALFAKV